MSELGDGFGHLPEGGEFCLFVFDTIPEYRLYELVIDCADHESASIWCTVIGGHRSADPRGYSSISGIPKVPFDNISFVPVHESKKTRTASSSI